MLKGALDSITGIAVVCYLDREVNRKNNSQNSEFNENDLRQRLSSSPSPKLKSDNRRQE